MMHQKDAVKPRLSLPEMRLRMLLVSSLIGALALPVAFAVGAQQTPEPSFVVVVSASNPENELARKEISKIFRKKGRRWPHGVPFLPVDQVVDSPVRQEFSLAIYGRGVNTVVTYWQRQIFSGHGVPPPELETDQKVLDYVGSHPGAIGYVRASTPLGSDVKALTVVGP